jgi:hypothetical protein
MRETRIAAMLGIVVVSVMLMAMSLTLNAVTADAAPPVSPAAGQ